VSHEPVDRLVPVAQVFVRLPRDGQQVPDAKGRVIAVGKKRGYPSRILDWTPPQVTAAYRAARALASR
jgi:hypothetical protein